MNQNKTTQNKKSVASFIKGLGEQQKADSKKLITLMKNITGKSPKMWGDSIVGFGSYHYKYDSGREGDWMLTGFAPRKQNISIYTNCDVKQNTELLKKLGKHKSSVSCIYVKKLEDIDLKVLEKIIKEAIKKTKEKYG